MTGADRPQGRLARHDLAIVLPDLSLGGAQRVVVNLIAAWTAAGRRLCLITLGGSDGDLFRLPDGVHRIALDLQAPSQSLPGALLANLARLRRLRSAIRQAGAPCVLSMIAGTNVVTLLASRGLGLRVVISERNDPRRQQIGRIWDILRRRTYRWADVVTANSAAAIEAMRPYVPPEKLELVPNGILLAPAVDKPAAHRVPVILAVGRLTHQKGFDVLLRAFARLAAEAAGWRLSIVGDGEQRVALQALAADLGIDDRVDWAGLVSDPWPYYLDSAVFALPSRFEGTPNAMLEAMAAGLPVIVADSVSAAGDLVVDGQTGLVFRSEDEAGLAAALTRLSGDSDLRRRLADAARQRVQAHDFDAVLRRWEVLLRLPEA